MPADLVFYDRFRPAYPPEAWRVAEMVCDLTRAGVVADIGSGTGIFAEQLLASGHTVYGVEPLAGMRELAAQRIGSHRTYHGINGSAEATTLADNSVDVVTAASALHWFEPVPARAELTRILRGAKWVVALWNFRVANATAFSTAFDQLWREHLGPPPAGNRTLIEKSVIPAFFCNGWPFRSVFENPLSCTEEQLLGLALSSSNAPSEGDARRSNLVSAIRVLHRQYSEADVVTVPYETVLYCGTLG